MHVVAPFLDLTNDATLALLATVGGSIVLTLVAFWSTSRKTKAPSHDDAVHTLPNRSWLLGDLPEMAVNAERLHEWLYETSLKFRGEPWRFYLPGIMNTLVLTKPELVDEVLGAQSDLFIRGKATNDIVEDLFGKSFITADGDRWYHQRKATVKFFSARALRTCMTVHMRKNMGQLNGVIDRAIAKDEPLSMLPLFQEFAMQTFTELALGIELNIIGTGSTHVLERAIREGSPVIMRRGSVPAFQWKLERWLNIGPERKVNKGMKDVRAWIGKLVPESLAAIQARHLARQAVATTEKGEEIKSLVELFIEQVDQDTDGLQAEDLPELILSLVIGARGTSSTTLAWYFLLLAKYPDVERKLRDELAASLPNAHVDSYVSTDDISKLVYLEATIKEALRLYSALPLNQRVADADTVIGGSIPVKKGDNFFIPMYTLARLPTIWGPDAAEFKPERWIHPETGELINHTTPKYLAFSTGARMCIGMRLAMLELRIVIVNLLKRYQFELAQPNDMTHVLSTELLPAQPVVVRWTRNTPVAA